MTKFRLEDRYAVAPQMRDYDALGGSREWIPYLMFFHKPNCDFQSVTTDAVGMRSTTDGRGNLISVAAGMESQTVFSVIAGGSTVFGVGATADEHTIPSCLNKITTESWLNFGGRAFNSTQELLLLILLMPKKINKIVIFSGVNNITISHLSEKTSPYWTSFYDQGIYLKSMETPVLGRVGVKKSFGIFIRELSKIFAGEDEQKMMVDFESNYGNMLNCFRRDLIALKALGAGMGAPVYFAMQPMASWIDKDLAPEEVMIFQILDNLSGSVWTILQNGFRSIRDRYFMDVERICVAEGIPYYNMNTDPAFSGSRWLFVDRVHMTDDGNALAARTLKRVFDL